jgi:DNA polymerase III epsilon subunit-like protein
LTGAEPDENDLIPISVSYDMGWQKRGKGFNSNTGQGAVMGLDTGKVIDYTTKTNTCRICEHAAKNHAQPRIHDCRKNHTGSSKSMEPLSAVELFQNATNYNMKYSTYTGDDSTTECYVHEQVSYGIEKYSDIIHIKRSLTTRLYNLSKSNTFVNCSSLSQKVINYLVKCFSISVNQGKGDSKSIQTSLKSIVPHAFGNHDTCSDEWCGYKQDPIEYRHTHLPYGKDLHGDCLYNALVELFSQYYSDAVVEKLAPVANSQRNESLNSVVGSKAPKIRFYGGSESNDYRVACAVAQTNIGHTYINQTLEAMGVEPGRICIDHNLQLDKKKNDDNVRKKTIEFKRRRNQLHSRRLSRNNKKEQQEGKTYESNVGLTLDKTSTLPSTSEATEVFDLSSVSDKTFITYENTVSEFTPRPTCPDIVYHDNIFYNIIVFDTETNATGRAAELCQLSAVDKSDHCSFSEYILPNNCIDKYASRVNKLSVRTVNGQRTLFKKAEQLATLTSSEAISRFSLFLESSIDYCKTLTDKDVCTILVGHNAKRFDIPVILRNSTSSFHEKMQSLGVLFGESLSIFEQLVRSKHPALQQADNQSCPINQTALYQCLFQETFEAHDAFEDVKALRKMLFHSNLQLSEEFIVNHCKPISCDYALEDLQYLDKRHEILKSMEYKLYNPTGDGVITKSMAEKIAGSGLTYDDLSKLFKDFGKPGLISILSKPPTKNERRPRVTKTARILAAIQLL